MTTSDAGHVSWISAHLFFAGGIYAGDADRVVDEIVEPFVRLCEDREWIRRWFFIRYAERGPHVRLRLAGSADVLCREVQPALEEFLRARNPDTRFEPSPLSPEWTCAVPEQRVGHVDCVAWIPYEPETDRYGGAAALPIAEDFFKVSSRFALATIKTLTSPDRAPRLGRALLATLTAMHAFFGNRAAVARFAHTYETGNLRLFARDASLQSRWASGFGRGFEAQSLELLPYVATAWECLEDHESMTPQLDDYRAGLESIRERLKTVVRQGRVLVAGHAATANVALHSIIPSYIHMTNNRLGVSIAEEAYLSHLIQRSLRVEHVEPSEAGFEA